jgi:hypothetical protein
MNPVKQSESAQAKQPESRKPWKKKSTVEVVLDQIGKQEKRVAELQKQLDAEKATLSKLLQAKKVLEST